MAGAGGVAHKQSSASGYQALHLALRGLDASMPASQVFEWLAKQINRQPEPYDLYNAGKALYQTGAYLGAVKVLQLYVEGTGAESPGIHLLGYAYAMCGYKQLAVTQLKRCVNRTHTLTPPPRPAAPRAHLSLRWFYGGVTRRGF